MSDCYVENFLHIRNMKKIYHNEKVLHMINVEQNVLIWRNVKKSVMWRNVTLRNYNSLSQITLFCCKICFVSIYAVLSQNLFCRDLRAFAWRKIEPKIIWVEKK